MTSTVLQSLLTDYTGSNISARSVVETFIAGGTIAAGDWVGYDATQTGANKMLYVVTADNTLVSLVAGVALEAASSGGFVRVCIEGYCASAKVEDTSTVGATLIVSTASSADGIASVFLGTETAAPIGELLSAPSGGLAQVRVFRK